MHGHRAAKIDPLDLLERDEVAALDPSRYGLTNPDQEFSINGILWNDGLPGASPNRDEKWKLKDIVDHLREVYVGRIGYEFMHSPSKSERLWFSEMLESAERVVAGGQIGEEEKKRIWKLLARSETFDHFLQAKFPNLKRYGKTQARHSLSILSIDLFRLTGLEGAESMLPAINSLLSAASFAGVEHVIMCMPHRGRLSLLTDLLEYSPTALFHKIKGNSEVPEELGASGDVISHLSSSPTLQYEGAPKPIKVSLLQNPSHLGKTLHQYMSNYLC